ncbi:hypothetical protein [Clostridium perfringens]|uniref:hypothetical protein n=1 Tax=Clostridium perfringens TaxID=1502 RepID=UPI0018D4DF64|nr:hypothetical protein [Clostridium perfringens]
MCIDKAMTSSIKEAKGAVTFLDVLGWKGIWQKRKDAINTLLTLIKEIESIANDISANKTENRGVTTRVLSISDTIAIFTDGNPEITIPIHIEICSKAIPLSIEKQIPLRGAIAYGNFSIEKNIMVGAAVDEAASWHEATDWIGVILTPSAKFSIDNIDDIEHLIEYKSIPFKKKVNNLNYCVEWKFDQKNQLYNIFNDMGPHVPEIAPKYLNTLEFINNN